MKKSISVTFMLFVFLSSANTLLGQEKKNSISISGSVAHYFGIDELKSNTFEDPYKFPISPGAELLYWRQLSSNIELGTGVNFQKVHIQSELYHGNVFSPYDYQRKFQYNEVSVPLLLKMSIPSKNKNHCYFTLGVYNGEQIHIVSKIPESVGWVEWGDNKTIAGYSKDHFFADLYFDAGYAKSLKSGGELSFAPFIKYRVNSTWVNIYQKEPIVGVKLNYSFKF